jgi:diacylglycerol kinase (CTP)
LAVDITAANTRSNGHGNRNAAGTIKDHVIVDWEIPRKVLHSSIGFLTLSLYLSQSSPTPVIKSLSAALLVVVPCDILRLKWPGPGSKFARLYEKCVGFLMRESEKRKMNGVIWYILGVNFALLVYPLDIAVVAILILSWADTAASTIGRLYGRSTPPLPPQTPILHLPLAPRKSSAGFVAATITGALITTIFYKYIGPLGPHGISWTFEHGVRLAPTTGVGGFVPAAVRSAMRSWGWEGMNTGGWVGLGVLGVVAGLVAGVAEALDLGSLDDNLTLPIISGGCIWGFFKLLSLFSS